MPIPPRPPFHIRDRARSLALVVLLGAACGEDPAGTGGAEGATEGATTQSQDATTVDVPTGGSGGDGTTTGGAPCDTLADCPQEVCSEATACTAGRCVFTPVPDGTPLAQQSPGDCAEEVCDGSGGTRLVAADDPPDDGVLCTLDVCDGMTPSHLPGMAPCYTGAPGTEGVGQCASGTQVCDDRGVPMGPCSGEVVPGAEDCDSELIDEDCDGDVNEAGAACVCAPGSLTPCYTGPEGTQGVGACAAGEQACGADGLGFGACVGEVQPGGEDCDGGELDEDCDGEVNEEGPSCVCGDGFVSAGEACDDGNLVDDDGCSSTCSQPESVLQVVSGGMNTCVLLTGGKVKCWGYGAANGIGTTDNRGDQPGEMGDALPYAGLGGEAIALAGGELFNCAILAGGKVKCWGKGQYGVLGNESVQDLGVEPDELGELLPFVDLGDGETAVKIRSGRFHTCVVLADGGVKCWGRNFHGCLGLESEAIAVGDGFGEMGDALPRLELGTGRTALEVDPGDRHTCAVLDDHSVRCWGESGSGQCGHAVVDAGKVPGSMGDKLPPVELGTGRTAIDISAGTTHTCALLDNSTIKCWGKAIYLGLESEAAHGGIHGDMGDALPAVKLGAGAKALSVSTSTSANCALLVGGAVKCWGDEACGVETVGYLGDAPGEMGDNLPALDLGTNATAVAVVRGGSSGQEVACALLADGQLKCWGANFFGQLGLGDTVERGDHVPLGGDDLPPVDF